MRNILPPSRPKRSDKMIESFRRHFSLPDTLPSLVFVRGYYLDTMGVVGKDDLNVYDDAAFLIAPNLVESYNANTNPSFVRKKQKALAQLALGDYTFYRGMHRARYKALRAFPEGVELPCTREGQPSTAQYINIHKGSTSPRSYDIVNSEGCLTIPDMQYLDFQKRVWALMDAYKQKTIRVILVENRPTPAGQKIFDAQGRAVT